MSRWVSPEEAKLWIANGGTKIPGNVGAGGRVYVTTPGAPRPGGTGPVRIDFALPKEALNKAGKSEWFQTLQTGQTVPVQNVQVHYPAP